MGRVSPSYYYLLRQSSSMILLSAFVINNSFSAHQQLSRKFGSDSKEFTLTAQRTDLNNTSIPALLDQESCVLISDHTVSKRALSSVSAAQSGGAHPSLLLEIPILNRLEEDMV